MFNFNSTAGTIQRCEPQKSEPQTAFTHAYSASSTYTALCGVWQYKPSGRKTNFRNLPQLTHGLAGSPKMHEYKLLCWTLGASVGEKPHRAQATNCSISKPSAATVGTGRACLKKCPSANDVTRPGHGTGRVGFTPAWFFPRKKWKSNFGRCV